MITLKSYEQILGRIVDRFLARRREQVGNTTIKVGDPSLSIMEAAAASDFRAQADILSMLRSRDLGALVGGDLDLFGQSEGVPRPAARPATGTVQLGDSAFAKISTRVFRGGNGVAPGALVLQIEDGSAFPATGQVYIGRGRSTAEGPISYTAVGLSGGVWSLTLATPVVSAHQIAEEIVLAQGGNRLIPAGTIVQTSQNSSARVSFTLEADVTLLDGEVSATGNVVASVPGESGNVGIGAITSFSNKPFATATVTNLKRFVTGQDSARDDEYRSKIRRAQQSRAKATEAAIVNRLEGVTAPDEAGQIVSVALVRGTTNKIILDDGGGYENKFAGQSIETLCESAIGGEQMFKVANVPVAPAACTSRVGPFDSLVNLTLSVEVLGVASSVTFAASHFKNPLLPTAGEVVAAINSFYTLGFTASTNDDGQSVTLYPKQDGADIRVRPTPANEVLQFPTRTIKTISLFRDGVLLSAIDFTFNRHTGDIVLTLPLTPGQNLTVGSADTYATVTAQALTVGAEATSVAAESGAEIWWALGTATKVKSLVGVTLDWAVASSPAWGNRIAVTSASPVWSGVAEGDWLVITDLAVPQGARGAFRVATRSSDTSITIERTSGSPTGTYTLVGQGVEVWRTTAVPQRLYLPAGAYSSANLRAAVTSAVAGVFADNVDVSAAGPEDNLYVLGANVSGAAVFALGSYGFEPSFAATTVSAPHTQIPSMTTASIASVASGTSFVLSSGTVAGQAVVQALRPLPDAAGSNRYSNDGVEREITTTSGTTVGVRSGPPKEWHVGDRLTYSRGFEFSPRDTLNVSVDGLSFSAPLYRDTKVVSFGGTLELAETDGQSLAAQFGTGWDWTNYQLAAKARTKTHSSPSDTNKTILYRWWRHGGEGNGARLQYLYPDAANQSAATVTSAFNPLNPAEVYVKLPSGVARGLSFRPSAKIGATITSLASSLYSYLFVAGFDTTAATRSVRINYTNKVGTFTPGENLTTTTGSGVLVTDGGGFLNLAAGPVLLSSGQTITGVSSGATAVLTSTPYGYTTLTLGLPSGLTAHGIGVGETVTLSGTSVTFLAGPKTVVAATSTTISYYDDIASVASTGATVGAISLDSAGEVTVGGTGVVTGDIFSASATAWPEVFRRPLKVTVAANGRSWTAVHYLGQSPSSVPTYYSVGATSPQFFPLVAKTAAQIANDVNAAGGAVSAAAVGTAGAGTATGTITDATYEVSELGGANPWWSFTDGFNFVASHTTPATTSDNFVFTLRNTTTPNLVSNADLANETFRLVPVTARSVAAWLSSPAVSGFGIDGTARATADGRVVLSSKSLGSGSSVVVTGGFGAVTSAFVRGSPTELLSRVVVETDLSDGLTNGYVWVQNSVPHQKTVFDASSTLASASITGQIALDASGTKAWTRLGSLVDNTAVMVERQGSLVALVGLAPTVGTNVLTPNVGWIRLQTATTPPSGSAQMPTANLGLFRVLRSSGNTVWIENAAAVEGIYATKYDFISDTSILPGDVVTFAGTVWGNIGRRTVTALGATEWEFVLDVSALPITPVTGPIALSTQSALYTVTSGAPARVLRQIAAILPSTTTGQMRVALSNNPADGVNEMNSAFGTYLSAAGKMSFDGQRAIGADGYRYFTGLLRAANEALYDTRAAGVWYSLTGPTIRRVQMSLVVRTAATNDEDLVRNIRNAVIGVVNSAKVGQSIAISDVIDAVSDVAKTKAISIASPTYNVANDKIIVAPHEKAFVSDSLDITVTLAGE